MMPAWSLIDTGSSVKRPAKNDLVLPPTTETGSRAARRSHIVSTRGIKIVPTRDEAFAHGEYAFFQTPRSD